LEMNKKLFATLESTGGLYIPLNPDRTLNQSNLRNPDASRSAPFPDSYNPISNSHCKHNPSLLNRSASTDRQM
ncbi:MAG: hypothetical protein ACK6DX_07820, partial [Acidobacteriota bacterium]